MTDQFKQLTNKMAELSADLTKVPRGSTLLDKRFCEVFGVPPIKSQRRRHSYGPDEQITSGYIAVTRTDAAAITFLEQTLKDKHSYTIYKIGGVSGAAIYTVTLKAYEGVDTRTVISNQLPTLALAICQAILEMVISMRRSKEL